LAGIGNVSKSIINYKDIINLDFDIYEKMIKQIQKYDKDCANAIKE